MPPHASDSCGTLTYTASHFEHNAAAYTLHAEKQHPITFSPRRPHNKLAYRLRHTTLASANLLAERNSPSASASASADDCANLVSVSLVLGSDATCALCKNQKSSTVTKPLVPCCECPECIGIRVHAACLSTFRCTTSKRCLSPTCKCGVYENPSGSPTHRPRALGSPSSAPQITLQHACTPDSNNNNNNSQNLQNRIRTMSVDRPQFCASPSNARQQRMRVMRMTASWTLDETSKTAATWQEQPKLTAAEMQDMSTRELAAAVEVLQRMLKNMSDELVGELKSSEDLQGRVDVIKVHAELLVDRKQAA